MTNRETCGAVERRPGKVSGAWAFRGALVPVAAPFENLKDGASAQQFMEWFPGVDGTAVKAVLDHEAKALENACRP